MSILSTLFSKKVLTINIISCILNIVVEFDKSGCGADGSARGLGP